MTLHTSVVCLGVLHRCAISVRARAPRGVLCRARPTWHHHRINPRWRADDSSNPRWGPCRCPGRVPAVAPLVSWLVSESVPVSVSMSTIAPPLARALPAPPLTNQPHPPLSLHFQNSYCMTHPHIHVSCGQSIRKAKVHAYDDSGGRRPQSGNKSLSMRGCVRHGAWACIVHPVIHRHQHTIVRPLPQPPWHPMGDRIGRSTTKRRRRRRPAPPQRRGTPAAPLAPPGFAPRRPAPRTAPGSAATPRGRPGP